MLRRLALCPLALALLVMSACSQMLGDPDGNPDGAFASEADYRQRRAAAVGVLETAIGTTTASDVSACRALAVGEKACGGPASISVFSTDTADPARVEAAADRIARLDLRANAQFDIVSTCVLISPPPLAVRDGVCVPVP